MKIEDPYSKAIREKMDRELRPRTVHGAVYWRNAQGQLAKPPEPLADGWLTDTQYDRKFLKAMRIAPWPT